jgi:peptidoglycan/LPS O-acetylase OafA/YrhL
VLRLAPIYLLVMFAYMAVCDRHYDPLALIHQALVLPATAWRNVTLSMEPEANPLMLAHCYIVGLEMMFYLIVPFLVRRSIYLLVTIWALSFIVPPLGLGSNRAAGSMTFFLRRWSFSFLGASHIGCTLAANGGAIRPG